MQEMFDEMIASQEVKLLKIANQLMPHLTEEDILQPFDFPLLETHPHFRYEEGYLKGLHAAKFAYLSALRSD